MIRLGHLRWTVMPILLLVTQAEAAKIPAGLRSQQEQLLKDQQSLADQQNAITAQAKEQISKIVGRLGDQVTKYLDAAQAVTDPLNFSLQKAKDLFGIESTDPLSPSSGVHWVVEETQKLAGVYVEGVKTGDSSAFQSALLHDLRDALDLHDLLDDEVAKTLTSKIIGTATSALLDPDVMQGGIDQFTAQSFRDQVASLEQQRQSLDARAALIERQIREAPSDSDNADSNDNASRDIGIGKTGADVKTKTDTVIAAQSSDHMSDEDNDELNQWIEQGNRAFGTVASPEAAKRADAFYQRYPGLDQFRGIAETRSPQTEYESAGGYENLIAKPVFDLTNLSPQERADWVRNQEQNRPKTIDGAYYSIDGGKTWLRNPDPTPETPATPPDRLDAGTNTGQPESDKVIFQGDYHSLDGGVTWLQNQGTPYAAGQNVIVDGAYHSLDGGQTWLQNPGTPFDSFKPPSKLDDGSNSTSGSEITQPPPAGDLYVNTDPATPGQIASVLRTEERAAARERAAEEAALQGPSSGDGRSFWDKALPWIQLGLQVYGQYEQIQQQQRAYQQALAQQRAYQQALAQQRAQANQQALAQQRAQPNSQKPLVPGISPQQPVTPPAPVDSSGCGPGYKHNPDWDVAVANLWMSPRYVDGSYIPACVPLSFKNTPIAPMCPGGVIVTGPTICNKSW